MKGVDLNVDINNGEIELHFRNGNKKNGHHIQIDGYHLNTTYFHID